MVAEQDKMFCLLKYILRRKPMLKVYYCANCKRIKYLSKEHDIICKGCDSRLIKIDVPYSDFVPLDEEEREEVIKEYL